ncbi:unnamed protein product [Bursaphelenchus okinawaensis]|uniref:Uncharacterized protein n=1 Tax=Bursaphelenchus okinawaensis TaxID=465554 RepID=A0A811LEH8_9BILA|nr:unnamed protein product [Bursaphelenchus okinawaensis]CAG9121555.1 unnamed protein product [Bursaphelenchus okinawaensis]
MSKNEVKLKKTQPPVRRSSGMLKTKEVTEIPADRRVLRTYTGTSEYRKGFYDIYVKPSSSSPDEAAIQTAVIQCKLCNMLMRNEGGHIKNHAVHTCSARKDRVPKKPKNYNPLKSANYNSLVHPCLEDSIASLAHHNLASLAEHAQLCSSPESSPNKSTENIDPKKLASESLVKSEILESKVDSEGTNWTKNELQGMKSDFLTPKFEIQKQEHQNQKPDNTFELANFLKDQALVMFINQLAQTSTINNQPVQNSTINIQSAQNSTFSNQPAGTKRKLSDCDSKEVKKPRLISTTRRKMRQNMLRTKDMEKISRDRFVLRPYNGTSEYRKQFFDVWVKPSASESDESAVETAVIQCKNCSRIMSNEGGHIKSHVQSACKGQPDSRTSPNLSKSTTNAPNLVNSGINSAKTVPTGQEENNAVLQLLLLQQLSQLQQPQPVDNVASDLLAQILNAEPAPAAPLFPLNSLSALLGTQF